MKQFKWLSSKIIFPQNFKVPISLNKLCSYNQIKSIIIIKEINETRITILLEYYSENHNETLNFSKIYNFSINFSPIIDNYEINVKYYYANGEESKKLTELMCYQLNLDLIKFIEENIHLVTETPNEYFCYEKKINKKIVRENNFRLKISFNYEDNKINLNEICDDIDNFIKKLEKYYPK